MLMPENTSPYSPDCWAIDITYEEDGHVKDDDAKDIKYNELLKQMQDQIKESNPERVKQGGRAIELTGWAEQPSYDAPSHKLYWAKKLRAIRRLCRRAQLQHKNTGPQRRTGAECHRRAGTTT
jgi:uncharacterized membrane-anchored protein